MKSIKDIQVRGEIKSQYKQNMTFPNHFLDGSMSWSNGLDSPMLWSEDFFCYDHSNPYNLYSSFDEEFLSWNLYDDLDQFLNPPTVGSNNLPTTTPSLKSESKNTKKEKKHGKSRRKISTLIENKFKFSGQRYLLLFTLQKLNDSKSSFIAWVKEKEGIFEIRNPKLFASEWGAHKERKEMTYEKVARSFRYYYKCDILKKVSGVRRYQWNLSFLADLKECNSN